MAAPDPEHSPPHGRRAHRGLASPSSSGRPPFRRLISLALAFLLAALVGVMSAGRTSQPTQADEPIPVGSAPTHAPFPKHRGKSDDLALAPPSAPRTSTKPLRKPKDEIGRAHV